MWSVATLFGRFVNFRYPGEGFLLIQFLKNTFHSFMLYYVLFSIKLAELPPWGAATASFLAPFNDTSDELGVVVRSKTITMVE